MTDIVERLRHRYPKLELGAELRAGSPSVAWEAAAEIERLRAALAEIAAHDDQFSSSQQARAMRDAARRALEPEP